MTVKEAIKLLQDIPDKDIAVMIDCPHCGHSEELTMGIEVVVLSNKKEQL